MKGVVKCSKITTLRRHSLTLVQFDAAPMCHVLRRVRIADYRPDSFCSFDNPCPTKGARTEGRAQEEKLKKRQTKIKFFTPCSKHINADLPIEFPTFILFPVNILIWRIKGEILIICIYYYLERLASPFIPSPNDDIFQQIDPIIQQDWDGSLPV
jgi:hypothetical protein